jgi:enamine deaminase RidA (YjgF/YER057c/UK114 family)
VFVQVFCSDVERYDAFNAVYRTFFKREFPAHASVGSGRLLFGALRDAGDCGPAISGPRLLQAGGR